MDSQEVQLNLKEIDDDKIFWIGVVYLNHRIRAKLAYMLSVEPEYALGLKPMKKGINQLDQDEEEKVTKNVSKKAQKQTKQQNEYSFQQESSDEEEEEDGDKSVKMTPKQSVIKLFETQGININECQQKAKKSRGDKRVLICPFVNCLKDFTETGNLKTHLRTHTGERPFVCGTPGCDKQFITKGHLKTHELIHSGDKPFVCDVCGKSYSRSGRLKIHVRTHTGEKPFRCNIPGCGKTFTEKGNLKTHMRIHSGEKPFTCSVDGCGKTFTTQGHLTDHMRRHSGERPFKCTFCPQSFMRSSTLKIHLRRHTGERPYECQECGKRFSESGNLKTHQKTHVNKKRKQNSLNNKKQSLGNHTSNKKELQIQPLKVQQTQATTLGKRKRLALKHISDNNLIRGSTLGVKRKKSNLELQKIQPKEISKKDVQLKEEEEEQIAVSSISNNQDKSTKIEQQPQPSTQQQQQPENESITLPLESTFMPNQLISEQSQSPQVFQPQQAFNPPLFTPKLNGVQGASPMSFTPITSTNASFNFPTSLSGFQRDNPSINGSKTKRDPTNKHSFQNFFASLQQNQNFNAAFNNQNNQINQSGNSLTLNNSNFNNNGSNQKSSSPTNRTLLYLSNNNIPLGPMSPQGVNVEPFSGLFSPNSKRNAPFQPNLQQQVSQQTNQQTPQSQNTIQSHINSLPSFGSSISQQQEQIQQLPTMNQISMQAQQNQNNLGNQSNVNKQQVHMRQLGSFNNLQHIPGMQELVNTTKNFQSPPMNPFPQPQFHISSNNLNSLNIAGFNLPRSGPTSKQNSNNNLLPFNIHINKINHPEKFPPTNKMKQSCDQLGGFFEGFTNTSYQNMQLNYGKYNNNGGAIIGGAPAQATTGELTNTYKDIQLNTSINGMMLGNTPHAHASTNNLNMFVSTQYKIFDQDQQNASLLLTATPIHHVIQQQTSQNSQSQQQFQQQQANQNQFIQIQQQQQIPVTLQNLQQQQQQQQIQNNISLQQSNQQSLLTLQSQQQQQQQQTLQDGGSSTLQSGRQIEEESFSSVVSKVAYQKSDSVRIQDIPNVSSVINHQKYQQQQQQ